MTENITGIAAKTGPGYRRWVNGIARYAEQAKAQLQEQTH
jgi:hypothetical protein